MPTEPAASLADEDLRPPPGKDEGWAAKRDDCAGHAVDDLFRLRDRVRDGVVLDASGRPLSTPANLLHLFAIDTALDCWVALEHTPDRSAPDAVKHDTLLRGQNVLGAGELIFENGGVSHFTILSGTYQVDREWEPFVRLVFERHGVELPPEDA